MNEEINKKLKSISGSKKFKIILCVIGCLVVASFIFQAGVFVGFHKASFKRDSGDNYYRNFGSMRRGPFEVQPDLPNAHGAVGKIIKVTLPTLIVEDKDNTEKVILIKDDTVIKNMREDGTSADLTIDTFVVVIGSPNAQGQIEAKLIRIIPAPAQM